MSSGVSCIPNKSYPGSSRNLGCGGALSGVRLRPWKTAPRPASPFGQAHARLPARTLCAPFSVTGVFAYPMLCMR
jgi:hypothetical protein